MSGKRKLSRVYSRYLAEHDDRLARRMGGLAALVLTGDHHCGCRLGLCPADGPQLEAPRPGIPLDDGGAYIPSESQRVLWGWWREFWEEFVPSVAPRGPIGAVFGGEFVEGIHHRVTTLVSHNPADQSAIADAVLGPVVKRLRGRFVALRGTEAHSGVSGSADEQLARHFGAIPNAQGQHSRYAARLNVQGWVVHATHHLGVGLGPGGIGGMLGRELADEYTEAARWNLPAPDIVVRYHTHKGGVLQVPTSRGMGTALSVPGWQMRTPFIFRKRYGRVAPAEIGAAVVTFHKSHYAVHMFCRTIG